MVDCDGFQTQSRHVTAYRKQESPANAVSQTRATQKDAKISPIRRVSFHLTEFHFPKFQITNA